MPPRTILRSCLCALLWITLACSAQEAGWLITSANGITFRSTAPLSPRTVATATNAWAIAGNQFPPRQHVLPSVVFAPTTEIFRHLTSQPGWLLASTSGTQIVLQPAAVFEANHVSMAQTLRHEMLHVVVESSASPKTPLWLREGLVEILAGETHGGIPALSAAETERLLQHTKTRQLSQAAHTASGARARLLVDRYGFSTVRGWLVTGAPVPTD